MVTVSMIHNDQGFKQILYKGECKDPKHLEYYEIGTNAFTIIQFLDDGLIMNRKDEDHTTILHLIDKNSYSVVESEYGQLRFDVDLLQYQRSEEMIYVRYRLTDTFTILFDFRSI